MSTNHLNDISRVYLAQVAEETPGEKIDRISQADVAKRKAKAESDRTSRDKKTAEFQKHKQSVLAKGGRPVDALDSWHKKQAHKEAYSLAEESAVEKKKETLLKIKKDAKDILKQDEIHSKIENEEFKPLTSEGANMLKDKEGHTTGGFRISNKEASAAKDRLHKNRRISIKMGSAGQELAKMEKDDDAFGAPKAKKVKKESFSDWRNDLREIVAEPEEKAEKEVTEKKVKNKVIINPTFQEAIKDIGGEVLDAVELDEVKVTKLDDKKKKEDRDKKVKSMLARQAEWENAKKKALHASHEPEGENLDEKDSYKTVAAVIDYDRSKKGTDDATYDSEHGEKKAAKKERDYAAWEREKMKRDDPNWKHKKGSTSESVEVDEYLETVSKVKKAENVADKERWAVDEAVKGEDTQDRKDAAAERRSGKVGGVKTPKRLSPSKGREYVKGTKSSIEWWKDHNKKKNNVEEQVNSGDNKEDSAAAEKQEKQLQSKEKRISQMKKMVLLKKMQAVRSGAGAEITASYEPEGEVIDETLMSVKAATYGMPNEKRKAIIDKYKRSEENRGTDKKKGRDAGAIARERLKKEETIIERPLTGYEDKKKEEVIKSLKKKKGEFTKRYGKDGPDVMYAVATKTAKKKGDTSKSDDRYAYEEIEFAVDYFYEQGINEDGLDLIIEEIGLDAFVEFVLNSSEELMEERAARKMNVRTKKKMPSIVASDAEAEAKRRAGKTGEYKETPKKKAKVGGPSYATKVEGPVKKMEKRRADDDLAGAPVKKKVEKAVVKVKPTQPKKEVSKGGLRDRISGAVKAGVKRHKKAVQPARVFGKGVASGVRSAVKFAGKAKKAVVGEEVIDEGNCKDCGCKGCGKNPCVECGKDHHKLGEEVVYEATGRWVDSKGRSHNFSISTNTVVDHGYIKELVRSRYPAKRIFIKTDKEKTKKKKDGKKVKKEGFSNWREENLTENGNKNKPGYVNIGMGVWVKKEDAEKKKAQLAKSVRGENIPGFKGGRLD